MLETGKLRRFKLNVLCILKTNCSSSNRVEGTRAKLSRETLKTGEDVTWYKALSLGRPMCPSSWEIRDTKYGLQREKWTGQSTEEETCWRRVSFMFKSPLKPQISLKYVM